MSYIIKILNVLKNQTDKMYKYTKTSFKIKLRSDKISYKIKLLIVLQNQTGQYMSCKKKRKLICNPSKLKKIINVTFILRRLTVLLMVGLSEVHVAIPKENSNS